MGLVAVTYPQDRRMLAIDLYFAGGKTNLGRNKADGTNEKIA